MMKTYYTTVGRVRGECGHKHRTVTAAQACAERDDDGCATQGGYSDRSIRAVENGAMRLLTRHEHEYLDSLLSD